LFIIIIGLVIVSFFRINGKTIYANLSDPTSGVLLKQRQEQQAEDSVKLTTLKSTVNSVISNNSSINFEISAVDISGGNKQLSFGVSGPMAAASVSKVLVAIDFLAEVEKGQQTMSETLDDGDIASYDMQQMIVVSDDTSWQSFIDQLTPNQLDSFARSIGVNSYDENNNTLSAYDTADLMAKLYEGKLVNKSNTDLLLGYLEQANYRQYMVPAVPSYDTIYHKIGLYNDNVNDAAIITNGTQSISLVIFTNGNGTYDWNNRATLMQEITTAFLSYYGLSH
jgi:beta-lactamase class A